MAARAGMTVRHNRGVAELMTIGDFSRAVRLSAKALRLYHETDLLVPAVIDERTGYRWYAPDQIADARIVRTLRDLEVPLDTVRRITAARDVDARAELMRDHLAAMEQKLAETRRSVESLRALLEPPQSSATVTYRSVPETTVVAVEATIARSALSGWFRSSIASLQQIARKSDPATIGAFGGVWSDELFSDEYGSATVFLTVGPGFDQSVLSEDARVITLPAVELAVAVHDGADEGVPAVYAAIGEHVARHEMATAGPVRETYLSGFPGIDDRSITEIGWPVFRLSR